MKFKPVSRLYAIFSLFLLFTLLLLISSCDTQRPYLKSEEPALQEVELNGIHVECLYMNFNDIEKKHGWKANPFLPPDLAITTKQTLVFDLKITNKDNTPVVLNRKNVTLHFGDKNSMPMSMADMADKIDEYAERADNLSENRVAKQYMLPSVTTINGNKTTTGYLVFMGGFSGRNIPTELTLTFTTPNGNTAADITFAYTLTLLKK